MRVARPMWQSLPSSVVDAVSFRKSGASLFIRMRNAGSLGSSAQDCKRSLYSGLSARLSCSPSLYGACCCGQSRISSHAGRPEGTLQTPTGGQSRAGGRSSSARQLCSSF
eukprot:3151761-Rhodomonas_salina.3